MKDYKSVVKVKCADDIKQLREKANIAEKNICRELGGSIQKDNLMEILKYSVVGFDPWNPEKRIHLIEQVNLHATYDVALSAVEKLMVAHPNVTSWDLAPGNVGGGPDVFSEDKKIVVEVFAARSELNNGKIGEDLKRLMEFEAEIKYLFYKTAEVSETVYDLPSPISVRCWRLAR